MMKIFFGAALAIALFGGAMSAAAQEEVYALYVDGLACPFCAYGIEKELTGLDGVQKVEVDINKGVVVVTAAEGAKIPEASLWQAVDNAGFTLRKVEGPVSKKDTN